MHVNAPVLQCSFSSVSIFFSSVHFLHYSVRFLHCAVQLLQCAFKPPKQQNLPQISKQQWCMSMHFFPLCIQAFLTSTPSKDFESVVMHFNASFCTAQWLYIVQRDANLKCLAKHDIFNKQTTKQCIGFVCLFVLGFQCISLFVCIGVHTNIVHIFRPFAMYQSHSFSTGWKNFNFQILLQLHL